MKNIVFWGVTPCGSCKNRCFGECRASIIRVTRIGELVILAVTSKQTSCEVLLILRGLRRLLFIANVVSSPILVTLMMEALRFSERSVCTRTTRRKIPKDWIPHSHRREYLTNVTWSISFVPKAVMTRARARVCVCGIRTFNKELRFLLYFQHGCWHSGKWPEWSVGAPAVFLVGIYEYICSRWLETLWVRYDGQ
jgi:hypothetical protein